MAVVPPSGGSGDRIRVDPLALTVSGATTPVPTPPRSPHAVRPRAAQGVGTAATQPDGVSVAINAIASTCPAQTGTFLADLSRAGNTVVTGDAGSAAQLEAQDAENAADVAAVAAGAMTVSV